MRKKEYLNTECIICGKKYHVCNCPGEESWKWCADTVNCYKIYQIIQDYNDKVVTADEAKELFKGVDLSDYKTFKPNNVKLINFFLGIKDDVPEKTEDAEPEPAKPVEPEKPVEEKKPEQFNRPVKFEIKHNKKK